MPTTFSCFRTESWQQWKKHNLTLPYISAKWVWIFSQHKNGSDLCVPLLFHANYTSSPASLKTKPLAKSLIENQSSALLGYSLLQTAHKSTQNDPCVPPFIRNIILSIKSPIRRPNSQKMRIIKSIYGLKTTQNTNHSINQLIEEQDSIWVMTTDQLLPCQKTYFCCVHCDTVCMTFLSFGSVHK